MEWRVRLWSLMLTLLMYASLQIEIRNGEAFFCDTKSTNGSQLNGEDCESGTPYRLKNGDIITVGSTELAVHLTNTDENEEIQDA